ncbi:hypothetical protein DRQ36_04890 [bacterium]|nr:MAG: hypothetical protein DRQ36_04890 [bacterium]
MKKKYTKIAIVVILLGILIGGAVTRDRYIYIFDGAGPDARFEHPDSPGDTIRPLDAWLEAIGNINGAPGMYSMKDTLIVEWGDVFPSSPNCHIVILSLGWDGSGAASLTPAIQAQLVEHLDSTGREPGTQTAVFIEGNDFAYLYCDTSSSHYTYAGTFADYTGALLAADDIGAPSTLIGEDNSLAEGMSFAYNYVPGPGPCTSMDDIEANTTLWDDHHLKYVFNASRRCPARGLQRRSYSPGAVFLMPFQFGNIPSSGANTKEELLAHMLDFAVMPLGTITTNLENDTLYIDSTYAIEFMVYDNVCVGQVAFDYTTDGGTTWNYLTAHLTPPIDTLLIYDFTVPATAGSECYLRLFVYDSIFNYTADTSDMFVIAYMGISDETPELPSKPVLSAHPNPFNSSVSITVVSKRTSSIPTNIEIFDINGRMVHKMPVTARLTANQSNVSGVCRWQPDESTDTGVYLARLTGTDEAIKIVLLK